MLKVDDDFLKRICNNLISYDKEIVEIVQFESSAYAPQYSKGFDLLVVTKKIKDYKGYLNAINSEDIKLNVIALEVGQKPKEELLKSILGSFNILYGDGRYLLEWIKTIKGLTFEEAKSSLKVASLLINLASETSNPLDKDLLIREAFESIFYASRIALLTFLSTEINMLGSVEKDSLELYRAKFNDFVEVLHVKYYCNGDYPKERVVEEFNLWINSVEKYVNELEFKIKEIADS
ncbi:MAG: hypothetical protein ACP5HX_08565 [Thermoproteota archaeon]